MIPNRNEHSISVIYKITNRINDKIYVGSAESLYRRYGVYKHYSTKGRNPRRPIQAAMQKYGFENFDFEILELVPDKHDLIVREQYWIDQLKPCLKEIGYNINPTASSWLGTKHSEEAKKRMSAAKRGKPRNLSPEARERVRKHSKRNAVNNPTFCCRPVVQIDCDTLKPITTFESIHAAGKATGISAKTIGRACSGDSSYAGGFLWCLQKDWGTRKVERKRRIAYWKVLTKYPVTQTNGQGAQTVWASGFEAAKQCDVDPKKIYRSVVSQASVDGIQWKCDLDDRAYENKS